MVVKTEPMLKKEWRRVCLVPNLKSMEVAVRIINPTNTKRPMLMRLIFSKTPSLFIRCMMYSKTTIAETVTINRKDNIIAIPRATAYCLKKPRVTVICLEISKPPKMALTPFAIKKIERKKPEESSPL